jgi:hypothetical protein
MLVAEAALAGREKALRYNQVQAVLGACHRDMEQALSLKLNPVSNDNGIQASETFIRSEDTASRTG